MSTLSTHIRSRSGLLAVSGGALLWGTTGVAVRIIHDRSGLSAVPIGCYRLAIAAVVLAVVFGRRGWSRVRVAFARHGWWLALAGVVLGGYQALYFVGVQYVGVSVSTLVSLAIAPVIVTAVTTVTARERPAASSLVSLGCAVVGLGLITLTARSSAASAPHPALGILASVGSGVGYAGATLLNRRLAAEGDALALTAATSGVGALVLLPLALPIGMGVPTDWIANGWLIYIGVFSTVVAYGLYYAGMRSVAPEVAAELTLLEPLTAAVLAVAFLHESLAPLGIVGAVLMLAALSALYLRKPDLPVLGP